MPASVKPGLHQALAGTLVNSFGQRRAVFFREPFLRMAPRVQQQTAN